MSRFKSSTAGGAMAIFVLAFTMFAAVPAWAEAPDKAASCIACHGDQGLSQNEDTPIIAGPSDFYLENQLFLFQSKDRPCAGDFFSKADEPPPADDHCALVADFSEDDIAELAAYFSAQPHQPADQPVDEKLVQLGAKIHERSCDRCHANGGGLALDDAGILAGQWKPYLIRTMKSFRDSDRWQEESMAEEMAELSDEDIKALADYYASQGK